MSNSKIVIGKIHHLIIEQSKENKLSADSYIEPESLDVISLYEVKHPFIYVYGMERNGSFDKFKINIYNNLDIKLTKEEELDLHEFLKHQVKLQNDFFDR